MFQMFFLCVSVDVAFLCSRKYPECYFLTRCHKAYELSVVKKYRGGFRSEAQGRGGVSIFFSRRVHLSFNRHSFYMPN